MSELTTVGSPTAANQAALANDLAFSLATTAHGDDKVAVATQDAFRNTTDSRLYQTVSGDLQVAPKPIGYIIGERVVRPMIDGIAYLWSRMPSLSLPTANAFDWEIGGGGFKASWGGKPKAQPKPKAPPKETKCQQLTKKYGVKFKDCPSAHIPDHIECDPKRVLPNFMEGVPLKDCRTIDRSSPHKKYAKVIEALKSLFPDNEIDSAVSEAGIKALQSIINPPPKKKSNKKKRLY